MSTLTPTMSTGHARRRSPLLKITRVEFKLVIRDVATVFFGLVFPALLITALAAVIPGFQNPEEDLGGLRVVDVYGPVVIGMTIATVALTILPAYLTQYRETGVLRRLATTPASPSSILSAQLIVNLTITLTGSILALLATVLIYDVDWPVNPFGLLTAFVLSTVAVFTLGLLIAAVAKNSRVASGVGMLVYFPMLFFAGVWTPGPAMPDGIRAIADFTHLGAATEAMTQPWLHGGWPDAKYLIVLAVWSIVGGFAAARLFRWE